jgi:transcription initiation factor TFIIB
MTPEWRTFTDSDGKQAQDALRCGAPAHPLLPHSSLGIYIGYSGNEVREMRMVRKLHMWNNLSYRERVLFHVFDTLTVNAANNGIPKTILEQAKVYFYDLSRMQVSRGDNRHGLVASSIYMACKEQGVPRSPKEIARIFNIKPTIMVKSCKKLMDLLRVPSEASTPTDFIQRFGTRIGLSTDMRSVAMHIADQIDKLNIVCPSTPPSIAASIIYMVVLLCNGGLSKKELATKCEISQVTIGKCFGELYPYRMHLLPKDTIEKFSIT